MTIHDALTYGPIVASDEDSGCFVTANGAYFNLWRTAWPRYNDDVVTYENIDCKPVPADMYNITAADLWDAGKAALEEWLNPTEELDNGDACPECVLGTMMSVAVCDSEGHQQSTGLDCDECEFSVR